MKEDRARAEQGADPAERAAHKDTEILEAIAGLLGRVSSGEKTLDIASRAIEFVARLSAADFAALVVPELDYTYRIVDVLGSVDPKTAGLTKKLSYTPVSRVLQGGERILLVSVADRSPGEIDDWIEAEKLVDLVLEPLVTRMGTKGLLAVGFRRERPELRGTRAEKSFMVSAVAAAGAVLSLAIESQEIVEAARTQAYHAEVLNVLLSKARRLGTVDEMLAECLQTLLRGLGGESGVACIVTASQLEFEGSASSERPEGELPYRTVARFPSRQPKVDGAAPSSPTGPPPEEASMVSTKEFRRIDKAALDASRRLLEISQSNRPAEGERPRGGMVAIFARGKLGSSSPPGFWVGFVPSAGRPSFVVGLRPESGPEFSSAEMRLLQRVAEEFSHYLSYAGAFQAEREAVRRLTDLDRTKSELLGVVSHELRTPLTSIRGFTTSLLEGIGSLPEEKQKRFLSIIDSQAERLSKLIDDFLDMSRLQEGAMVLEIGRVDIAAVAARIADQYASQAAEKGMEIRVEQQQGVETAVVEADEAKVDQILTNLVSNAIKYGAGTVTIGISAYEDGFLVSVEDEGPGVPDEKRREIFERFVQADSSSTRRASGVGLGLAIAKGLAEAHGGDLFYEKRQPRGARFVLYLPIIPRAATPRRVF